MMCVCVRVYRHARVHFISGLRAHLGMAGTRVLFRIKTDYTHTVLNADYTTIILSVRKHSYTYTHSLWFCTGQWFPVYALIEQQVKPAACQRTAGKFTTSEVSSASLSFFLSFSLSQMSTKGVSAWL